MAQNRPKYWASRGLDHFKSEKCLDRLAQTVQFFEIECIL
jgi:hypothetical protein